MTKLTKEEIKQRIKTKIASLESASASIDNFTISSIKTAFGQDELKLLKDKDIQDALDALEREGVIISRDVEFSIYITDKIYAEQKDKQKIVNRSKELLWIMIVLWGFFVLLEFLFEALNKRPIIPEATPVYLLYSSIVIIILYLVSQSIVRLLSRIWEQKLMSKLEIIRNNVEAINFSVLVTIVLLALNFIVLPIFEFIPQHPLSIIIGGLALGFAAYKWVLKK